MSQAKADPQQLIRQHAAQFNQQVEQQLLAVCLCPYSSIVSIRIMGITEGEHFGGNLREYCDCKAVLFNIWTLSSDLAFCLLYDSRRRSLTNAPRSASASRAIAWIPTSSTAWRTATIGS
jgi:hypothetical protein